MSKVILKGYILVPDCDLTAVINALDNHMRLTRLEDGCIVFNVTQDETNTNRFNVYEEFSSQRAFELHQDRVRNSEWGEITVNVERHYQFQTAQR